MLCHMLSDQRFGPGSISSRQHLLWQYLSRRCDTEFSGIVHCFIASLFLSCTTIFSLTVPWAEYKHKYSTIDKRGVMPWLVIRFQPLQGNLFLGYLVLVYATMSIGDIGLVVWSHNMYSVGLCRYKSILYTVRIAFANILPVYYLLQPVLSEISSKNLIFLCL